MKLGCEGDTLLDHGLFCFQTQRLHEKVVSTEGVQQRPRSRCLMWPIRQSEERRDGLGT